MNAPWRKHAQPVRLDREALNDYMAIDKMAGAGAEATVTVPSRQVLEMLEEMAELAVQHDAAREAGVGEVLADAAYRCLARLGYTPAAGEDFAFWWAELLWLLARRAEAQESGPRAGEQLIDWDIRIHEAETRLTGRPS